MYALNRFKAAPTNIRDEWFLFISRYSVKRIVGIIKENIRCLNTFIYCAINNVLTLNVSRFSFRISHLIIFIDNDRPHQSMSFVVNSQFKRHPSREEKIRLAFFTRALFSWEIASLFDIHMHCFILFVRYLFFSTSDM